jgi:methylamine---glutamate N-methyltransferase subunit C
MTKPIVAANSPKAVELESGKTYYFCSCGLSANQPFCDGSHKGSGLAPEAFTAKKDGTAYLCQCKSTNKTPFCDGSHSSIPDEQVGKEVS